MTKDSAFYFDLKNEIKKKFIDSGCAEIKDIEAFDYQLENIIIKVEDQLKEGNNE